MPTEPLVTLSYFTGLTNVEAAMRFLYRVVDTPAGKKAAYPLRTADNMDIDDSYLLSSRAGTDLKLSGTDCHSLWSNEAQDVCMFVDGETLYELTKAYTSSSLLFGLVRGARMSYAEAATRIYLTNGQYIGYYYNHAVTALSDPNIKFKAPLPAGQRIAYFKGQVLVARQNVLYISDALCDHYDQRTGYRQFENYIDMVRPVDKGVYVSDGKTHFLSAGENFRRDKVLDTGCIPFTDLTVSGKDIREGLDGNFAVWTSETGICIGTPDGQARCITDSQYSMESYGHGGAVLRQAGGLNHYIAAIQ